MKIVITGGAGFLGVRLARTLLAQGTVRAAGAPAQAITQLVLLDRAAPPPDLQADPRVRAVIGDLNQLLEQNNGTDLAIAADTAIVFHLAAAVSGECEADFDLGMRSNFSATHRLLEVCRSLGTAPVLVFASSLAVFGLTGGQSALHPMDDDSLPTPQTSYGIQKFIGEQMVADYTRKGFVQGRSTRLMTVCVRPGKPNGAASGFLSGMLREPLAGLRARVPVPAATPVALASPASTVQGLITAAQASGAQWGPRTAINLPALQTTVGDMAAALERVAGSQATALLDWALDSAVERIVASWPARVLSTRAQGLGLRADASMDAVIRQYMEDHPQAVKLP